MSWLWVLFCLFAICYIPYEARERGQREYQQSKDSTDKELQPFCNEIYSKSFSLLMSVDAFSYLRGIPLEEGRLLTLKQAIRSSADCQDILFSEDNNNLKSLTGTTSFDTGQKLGKNTWRITIAGEPFTLIKYPAGDSAKNLWIAVIWRNTPSTKEIENPSKKYLIQAVLEDLLICVVFFPGLLAIRLQCEIAILFFRFVDEVVGIHNTIKTQKENE